MSVFAFTNGYVLLNSVNLSDHVKSVTLTIDADAVDSTGMGATFTSQTGSLKKGTLAIEFMDDYAASNVDATLWAALGTVVAFEVRPDAGARSATNPGYTGNVLVTQTVIGGKLGDLASKSVSFPTSGTVTRATA